MAQRAGRIGEKLGAPAQQLLPEVFDLQRVHELFVVVRTIVWRQHRAHISPQTPVQNGGGVYESRSLDSTVNAAIHRVDSARIPPKRRPRREKWRPGRRNAAGSARGATALAMTAIDRRKVESLKFSPFLRQLRDQPILFKVIVAVPI